MLIDAHQHYWNPSRGDYGWIPKGNPILDHAYGPEDLAPWLERSGIGATVLVQAAPTVAETEYLLDLATRTDSVAAVVGWVDFETPAARADLERFRAHPKFRGVRPVIQDIPNVDWMLREDLDWAFRALIDLDLTFDALGFPRHLANFHTLLKRYPDLRAVIDHCMKPQIRDSSHAHFRSWADGMTRLARDTNACVKLSGIVTEDHDHWSVERLRPYVEHVFQVFGPSRIMWGSDWPVCRLRTEYDGWRSAAEELTKDLSPEARDMVYCGTAARFYRIG
ncbi:MAG: hypothetical protein RLZZ528_405 [Pseudomonadota bacterium]